MREAQELLGINEDALRKFMGRHHMPRYVRYADLVLTRAASSERARSDLCVVPEGHAWDMTKADETDTGEPLRWCTRKGCPVGAVLHDDGTVDFTRRPV